MPILIPAHRVGRLSEFDVGSANPYHTFTAAVTGDNTLFTFTGVSEIIFDPPPPILSSVSADDVLPIDKYLPTYRRGLHIKSPFPPLLPDLFVSVNEIATKMSNSVYWVAEYTMNERCFPTSHSYKRTRSSIWLGDVFKSSDAPSVLVYDSVVDSFYYLAQVNGEVKFVNPINSEVCELDGEILSRHVLICRRHYKLTNEGVTEHE